MTIRTHEGAAPPSGPAPVLADRFEVVDRLSSSSTTEVLRARDLTDGATVALKLLKPDVLPRSLPALRFEHEATILETVDHPNVIRLVYPLTKERGVRYFAMEYAAHGSLRDVVNRDPAQPLDLFLTVISDVLRALEDLHAKEIIHRDVKPENMLVTAGTVGKLADFGIARDVLNLMTYQEDVLGTPTFMAPEQIRDPRAVGPATDVFAVGASLFALVTGRPGIELVASGFRQDALKACPPLVRPLVARATEHSVEERFPDARTMRSAVDEVTRSLVGERDGEPRRARLP